MVKAKVISRLSRFGIIVVRTISDKFSEFPKKLSYLSKAFNLALNSFLLKY